MNQAQRRVAAAEKALDDAQQALHNARAEAYTLAAREQNVDAAIREAIDTAVRDGKPADVGDAHATLRSIRDQRATAEAVAQTLVDVVREREQALAAARLADYPELRSALVKRADTIADRVADVHARYAAELAPLEAETRQVQREWDALRRTLPRAVAGAFNLDMVDLDIPNRPSPSAYPSPRRRSMTDHTNTEQAVEQTVVEQQLEVAGRIANQLSTENAELRAELEQARAAQLVTPGELQRRHAQELGNILFGANTGAIDATAI